MPSGDGIRGQIRSGKALQQATISTVSDRNAWDHDLLFCVLNTKKKRLADCNYLHYLEH